MQDIIEQDNYNVKGSWERPKQLHYEVCSKIILQQVSNITVQ
jgi:hypothetical protein